MKAVRLGADVTVVSIKNVSVIYIKKFRIFRLEDFLTFILLSSGSAVSPIISLIY